MGIEWALRLVDFGSDALDLVHGEDSVVDDSVRSDGAEALLGGGSVQKLHQSFDLVAPRPQQRSFCGQENITWLISGSLYFFYKQQSEWWKLNLRSNENFTVHSCN